MAKVEMRSLADKSIQRAGRFSPPKGIFCEPTPLRTIRIGTASHQPKTAKEPIAHNGTEAPAVKETGE